MTQKPRRLRTQVRSPSGLEGSDLHTSESKSEKEDRLRIALQQALTSLPSRSARLIAISIGYSSPDRILMKFPALCAALKMRLDEQAEEKAHSIRETLQAAMLQSPPPTLQEIAKEV